MPAQAAELDEALKKKGGLTLTQLANYDDIITDALVDRVYFWSKIRKVRPNARPCRGIREEEVCKILQKDVIIEKDPMSAQKSILQQTGMVSYMRSLGTADEKEHFERHLRKYVNIYMPDCPFEVCTTHRYTIVNAEACVVARKTIKAGDTVKYLSGIQVEMSEREEKELSSRTDFSIVLSSRRKRPSLFLGPARFANHDCDSNARLTTTGPHGIHIVARKNIAVGDEITVKYGEDYFGEDNCECLCGTCERLTRNGWDPRGPIIHEDSSDESETEEEPTPKKRNSPPMPRVVPSRVEKVVEKTTSLKRKRGQESAAAAPAQHTSATARRVRPRRMPISEEAVTTEYTEHARDFLARWFERRTKMADPDGDIDLLQVEKASLTDQFDGFDVPGTMPRHLELFDQTLRAFAERGRQRIRQQEAKIQKMNTEVAAILGIPIGDVPKYYAAPGEKDHIPLPTPPRELREHPCKEEPRSDTGVRFKTPPSANTTIRQTTPDSASDTDQASNDVIRSDISKARLTSSKRQRTASSLRHVMNAEEAMEEDDDDMFNVQESPAPTGPSRPDIDSLKRKRTRPKRHQVQNNYGVEEVATEAERNATPETLQAATTTDDSSMSSVFSTESAGGQVSPMSSVGETDAFAAGSICQNIVELYTTSHPTKEEEEDSVTADAIQDQIDAEQLAADDSASMSVRQASKRNGKVLRKSARHSGSPTPLDTVPSIERIPKPNRPDDNHNDQDEDEDEDGEEQRGTPRTPGDYYLTQALLVDPNCRWVECRNCDQYFVQRDAYQTRIACPRCERHSKLYGFYWPKTDRTGKDDKEERILDHRQIHRFIEPEEERFERKGRNTLVDVLKERDMSASQEADSSQRSGSRDDSRRRSRRLI